MEKLNKRTILDFESAKNNYKARVSAEFDSTDKLSFVKLSEIRTQEGRYLGNLDGLKEEDITPIKALLDQVLADAKEAAKHQEG